MQFGWRVSRLKPRLSSYNTEDHYDNVFVTHNDHFLYAIEYLGTDKLMYKVQVMTHHDQIYNIVI